MYGRGCGRHAHLTQLRPSRSQPRKGTGTDCPGRTCGRNGPGHRIHLLASILLGLSTVSDTSLLWTLEPRPAFRRSSQIFYSDIRPGEIFFLEMFKRNTSVFLYKIWQTIKITQERPLLISFGRNTQIGLLLCSVALSSITTRCMHITQWLVYSNRNRFSADYLGRQVGLRPAGTGRALRVVWEGLRQVPQVVKEHVQPKSKDSAKCKGKKWNSVLAPTDE